MTDQRSVSLVFDADELPILVDALRRRFTQVKKDRAKVISMAAHVKVSIELLEGENP